MLKAENISYIQDQMQVLNNFSYSFSEGEIIGILCPVKERGDIALKVLCGLTQPDEGKLYFKDADIHSVNNEALMKIRKEISIVFRIKGLLSNLTVAENLFLPLDFQSTYLSLREKSEAIKSYLNLYKLEESILEMRPAKLSVRENKIALLIRSFITQPRMIFYEEPTEGLDIKAREITLKEIFVTQKAKQVTQIITTHSDLELIKKTDILLVIENGNLVETGDFQKMCKSENPITNAIMSEYNLGINNEIKI